MAVDLFIMSQGIIGNENFFFFLVFKRLQSPEALFFFFLNQNFDTNEWNPFLYSILTLIILHVCTV